MQKLCLFVVMILLTAPVQAEWFTTKGSAPIINGDTDYAREQAIQNALKQALIQSGASISSLQQVKDGVLVQDYFQVRADSEIRGYEILQGKASQDRFHVLLQADITPEQSSCQAPIYAKSIVLARFRLENPAQARDGQLFEINRAISAHLHRLLSDSKSDFVTHPWLDRNLNLHPDKILSRAHQDSEQLIALGRNTDSQFLLFGVIRDLTMQRRGRLSLSEPETLINYRAWLDRLKIQQRNLTLSIYLYDTYHSTLALEKEYQLTHQWNFDHDAKIDVYGNDFWRSEFGLALSRQLEEILVDVSSYLKCKRPEGRIIATDGSKLTINLGRRNGLKIGERLKINHQASFMDQFGLYRDQQRPITALVEVIRLQEYNAILAPVDNKPAGNVQIRDLTVID